MNVRCSYSLFDACQCSVKCLSETSHIQIIVDRSPLRPFPKHYIALCGLIAAIVGLVSMYGLGSRLDDNLHQQNLAQQEQTHHG